MLIAVLLLYGWAVQAPPATPATSAAPTVPASTPARAAAPALTTIQRVFVDSFGTDPDSRQVQALLITALVNSKRFVVTENRDRADAILRGEAIAHRSQEVHAYGEGTSVGTAGAAAVVNGGSGAAAIVGRQLGASDSSLDTETVESATVTVRLVSADGDVIWSTTQQSGGGKYEGAEASAADACVKQLLHDAVSAR